MAAHKSSAQARTAARRASGAHSNSMSILVSSALAKNSTSRTPSTTLPALPACHSAAMPRLMSGELMGQSSTGRSSCDDEFEISRGEVGFRPHLKARTIAVVPWWRRMHLNFALQLELGDATQVLAQDFLLDFELVIVAGMLVVASAAGAKVRAGRWDAVRPKALGLRLPSLGRSRAFLR